MEGHTQSSETAGSIGQMASLDLSTILRNTSTSVTLSQRCLDRTMPVLFGCLKRNGMRNETRDDKEFEIGPDDVVDKTCPELGEALQAAGHTASGNKSTLLALCRQFNIETKKSKSNIK